MRDLFLGVYPANKLPTISYTPCCFILNTDPDNKPGRHWIFLYFSKEREMEYFDSYGKKPNNNLITKYIPTIVWYNGDKVQHDQTNTCGAHCIYVSYFRCRGFTLNSIIKAYSNDAVLNDINVVLFLDQLPKTSPSTIIQSQCCESRTV